MNKKEPQVYTKLECLEALKRYNILDTLPEHAFDDATTLVSVICSVPIAYVSFIDQNKRWFKSENESRISLIQRKISHQDADSDSTASEELKIRFFEAVALTTPDGYNIGSLCAADYIPRQLDEYQLYAMKIVARNVINQLELGTKNNELAKQKKIAQRAVKAKDSFLANMSHEIRTPLNAVIGFTDLLAQTQLNKEQLDYVNSVQTAGENLLLIVNDILDLSKIESGSLILDKQPFHLKKELKHIYELLKVKVPPGVEFNLFLDADLPEMVLGDKGRLNQILVNLTGNALKFTRDGDVTVSVKKIEETNGVYAIKFSVKDTGIGIPEAHIKNIFERFTQAEESTTRTFGGTGLGLNIARQLIEMHNADIQVKSREGIGSEFFFTIDYLKGVQEETQSGRLPVHTLGRLKILLCEDNMLNQKLVQNVIHKFGFDLDIAENGEQGIEMLAVKRYDLVLMDVQMPVKDGYQATYFIRNQMKSKIPIIAMTAHSLAGEQDRCFEAGMDAYVPKPFRQTELLEAIIMVMKKER